MGFNSSFKWLRPENGNIYSQHHGNYVEIKGVERGSDKGLQKIA
jgi:hypothetical protein